MSKNELKEKLSLYEIAFLLNGKNKDRHESTIAVDLALRHLVDLVREGCLEAKEGPLSSDPLKHLVLNDRFYSFFSSAPSVRDLNLDDVERCSVTIKNSDNVVVHRRVFLNFIRKDWEYEYRKHLEEEQQNEKLREQNKPMHFSLHSGELFDTSKLVKEGFTNTFKSRMGDKRIKHLKSLYDRNPFWDEVPSPESESNKNNFQEKKKDYESLPMFRKDGDKWTVSFNGTTKSIDDLKGMHYISYLLASPRQNFYALQLVTTYAKYSGQLDHSSDGKSSIQQSNNRTSNSGDYTKETAKVGEILDPKTKEIMEDLRDQRDEAKRNNDYERLPNIEEQIEALQSQIIKATGLFGRRREFSDENKKARNAVGMAISRAIRKIKRQHPKLGSYLDNSIKKGMFLFYSPETLISWLT